MKKTQGFSDFEKEAMKERARELLGQDEGEAAVLAKIEVMTEPDKTTARRIHELVKKGGQLTPKTWYGMPAYANSEGKVVCFFQAGTKFKARYATLGFSDTAKLDSGEMWATSYAITKLTPKVEAEIRQLLAQAIKIN